MVVPSYQAPSLRLQTLLIFRCLSPHLLAKLCYMRPVFGPVRG